MIVEEKMIKMWRCCVTEIFGDYVDFSTII